MSTFTYELRNYSMVSVSEIIEFITLRITLSITLSITLTITLTI